MGWNLGEALFGTNNAPQYYGQAQNALNQVAGNAAQYGQQYGQNMGSYNQYNGGYQQALGNLTNYLQQNPYTDSYSTAQLNNMTAGMAGDYQRQLSNLTAQNAQRGFGGPGQNSSMQQGGQTSLAGLQLANTGNARNQVAMNAIGQQRQNLQELTGLQQGAAQQYYGQAQNALGAQAGLNQGLASDYMNMGNTANQQYQQRVGNVVGGISGLLGTAANVFTGGMYGSLGGMGRGGSNGGGYGIPLAQSVEGYGSAPAQDPYAALANYGSVSFGGH